MIFSALYKSLQLNELLLIYGGYCRWHLRLDGQLTIFEILSTRPGAGTEILAILKNQNANNIFCKCPSNLESNNWYFQKGFHLEGKEITKAGTELNLWRLQL